jgi:hypothetical protein
MFCVTFLLKKIIKISKENIIIWSILKVYLTEGLIIL